VQATLIILITKYTNIYPILIDSPNLNYMVAGHLESRMRTCTVNGFFLLLLFISQTFVLVPDELLQTKTKARGKS